MLESGEPKKKIQLLSNLGSVAGSYMAQRYQCFRMHCAVSVPLYWPKFLTFLIKMIYVLNVDLSVPGPLFSYNQHCPFYPSLSVLPH